MKKMFQSLVAILVIGTIVTIWEWLLTKSIFFSNSVALIIKNSYYIVPYMLFLVAALLFPERIRNVVYTSVLYLTLLAYLTHFLNVFHTFLEMNSPYVNETENISILIETLDNIFRFTLEQGIDKAKEIITSIFK